MPVIHAQDIDTFVLYLRYFLDLKWSVTDFFIAHWISCIRFILVHVHRNQPCTSVMLFPMVIVQWLTYCNVRDLHSKMCSHLHDNVGPDIDIDVASPKWHSSLVIAARTMSNLTRALIIPNWVKYCNGRCHKNEFPNVTWGSKAPVCYGFSSQGHVENMAKSWMPVRNICKSEYIHLMLLYDLIWGWCERIIHIFRFLNTYLY